MNFEEIPMYRERDPHIDFIKLQLLNTVNQLKLEMLMSKTEFRKKLKEMFLSNKDVNKFVTSEVVIMKDRIDYLLEIAKNLLRDPSDLENIEYHRFENMVEVMLGVKLVKKKKFGLQKKRL